jgi:SNF2 family DNA or RNA helicase
LGSMGQFTERFSTPIERNQDTDRKIALKKLVQPFILRRKKNEVLDELPAKTEITLTVELSDAERSFYEALRQNAIQSLSNMDSAEIVEKRFQILAEITKLRQACCHPSMIDPQLGLSSSKLDLFGEIVEELLENNHKALVFSQFTKHLRLIEEYVKKKGIKYHYLDGQTPLNQREDYVKRFQRGEGDLFLISLKAGGVGLNLTAADYVIHMDPWWNPAVEDQASDRAHRIGQQRPVTVYRFITQNTIEEKIVGLHATKRDLADSLLEGTDSSGKLSAEELLNLIRFS